MNLLWILVIVLLLTGLPQVQTRYSMGYYPMGGGALILVILVVLLLSGRLQ